MHEIDGLAESLSKEGQLSPIRVRKHPTMKRNFLVVFGNRRLAAARKLGWKTIRAEVIEANDTESIAMAFSENVDRQNFSDYEKAMMLQELHDSLGKSYAEVADKIGKSAAFVSQHIAMLHLFPSSIAPEADRLKVLNSLTEYHSRVLARIDDVAERWSNAKLAVGANLSVRELKRICRDYTDDSRQGNATGVDDERENPPNDSKKLSNLVMSIFAGLNSRDIRPLARAVSLDHFNMFPGFSSLPSLVDSTNINDNIAKLLSKGFKITHEAPEHADFRIRGKLAYASVMLKVEIDKGERIVSSTKRVTIIFEKERATGEWKIVHMHFSFPLDIESTITPLNPQFKSNLIDTYT